MEKQQLYTHAHCVYKLSYHIVFVTKYRHKALTGTMLDRLRELFLKICDKAGCMLIEMIGEADHVHLLIDANPNIQPSRLVNTLKTISSREIRREFGDELGKYYWKPVLWHRSYCIVSSGGAPLDILIRYIQNQDG